MHRYGCSAARAALCAGKQGKFFEYHDQIFDNQESLSEELLIQVASNLALDINAFTACQSDPQTEALLQKNIEWGNSVKVEFTPTIIVNGHKLGSAMAPAQLEALLDYLRAERSKK
jgi:protein-disulfide isomerase